MEESLEQIIVGNSPQNNRIRSQPYGMVYDIDYSGPIGQPSDFLEDFAIYRSAGENDILRLHINSEGGQLNTLIQLINSIRNCRGTVITILESEAHSASGALFLAGDQFMVGDHAAMLVHEPAGGNWDYHSKSKKYQEFSVKHSEDVFADYYKDFLTDEELESVLEGKDLWLTSEEITERLEVKCADPEEDFTEHNEYCKDIPFADTLERWKKKDLQIECDNQDIPYNSKTTKQHLINKILENNP